MSPKQFRSLIIFAAFIGICVTVRGQDNPPPQAAPIVALQKRAEAAALVLLVRAEPSATQTKFKIVEYWKRQASDATISQYFNDGYLPFKFPSRLNDGQLILAMYFLPNSSWNDPTDCPLIGSFVDGKLDWNQLQAVKPTPEYSQAQLKELLSNDKPPYNPPPSVCPIP